MKPRAIIVARVSTIGQDKEDLNGSLDRQLRQLRATAEELGFEVVAEERNAASGAKEESPHFQRVSKLATDLQANAILFAAPDRFARNVLVGLQHLYRWMDAGLDIYIARDRVDLQDPSKTLIMILQLAAAQFQRDKNAEGSRAKHVYAAQEGRWYRTRPPVGYQLEPY